MATIQNVTVLQDFTDGTLADVFMGLNYPPVWKRGERRDLPKEVVDRVAKSGGIITIADDDAPESRIVEGAEPAEIDLQAHYRKKYGKVAKMTVAFPEGFRDGTLANELAAVGHPAEFGVGEIAELPIQLVEKLVRSGAFLTSDPATMLQHEAQQGKHRQKVKEWQEEQTQIAKQKKAKEEANEHNESILAELEPLYAEHNQATGAEKEALWQRIRQLKKSLK